MKRIFFDDFDLLVFDDVYEPDEDSFLLAKHVRPSAESTVLDMGTGSGIVGIVSASKGARVLSVDVNRSALKNVEFNAARLELTDKITTLHSDMFEKVKGKFDYIYFNPPYAPSDEQDAKLREKYPELSKAWDGGIMGRELIERFIKNVGKHMHEHTVVLMVASSKNDFEWVRSYLEANRFKWEILEEKACFFEVLSVFRFTKA